MLAIAEGVPGFGLTPDETILHKPVGGVVEEFQAIACTGEGITFPPPKHDVPLNHESPHQHWCGDCLVITAAAHRRECEPPRSPHPPGA